MSAPSGSVLPQAAAVIAAAKNAERPTKDALIAIAQALQTIDGQYNGLAKQVGSTALSLTQIKGSAPYQLEVIGTPGVKVPGSVRTTINQKASDYVDVVVDFGADPTGALDSTVKMQSAFDASNRIWIPPGVTIYVPGTVNISPDHQIIGCSDSIIFSDTANPVFYMPNPGDGHVYNSIFLMTGFEIDALNPLKIGDPDALGPSLALNSTMMGGHISGMIFNGPSATVAALEAAVPHTTDPATNAAVIGATGAAVSPIVIQVASSAAFLTNSYVFLSGVLGNTAANGLHVVTNVDATHVSLNGTTGNGAWAAGGSQNIGIVVTGYWTSAYPSLTALRSLGVGITAVNIYKYSIDSDCIFQGFGIGIYTAGIDQSGVYDCRFHNNGRNIHASDLKLSPNFSQGSCKYRGNDFGAPFFNGNLYIDGPSGSEVAGNFLESTDAGATQPDGACTALVTRGDASTQVYANQFILGARTATGPIMDIGAYQLFNCFHNTFATAGSKLYVVADYSNWNISFPVRGSFTKNTGLPGPNLPGFLDDSSTDYRFSANSIPNIWNGRGFYGPMFNPYSLTVLDASFATPIVITVASGAPATGTVITGNNIGMGANGRFTVTNIDGTHFSLDGTVGVGHYTSGSINIPPYMPWVFNATVQEWVVDKPGFQGNVSFPLNPKDTRWHFKFMGMSASGDLTYSIYYVTPDSVRHKMSVTGPNAYPTNPFPATMLGPGETQPFSLPPNLPSNGMFELDLSLSTGTVLYSAELIPEVEERRQVRVISLPLGASAPSTGQPGTFQPGDLILNSTTAAGLPAAWQCTVAGTQNSIGTAVLGTITIGTTSLSITSGGGDPAALLAIGDYINVVGVTGPSRIVDLVSPFPAGGPAIATLDTPASASVSGAIISHATATFVALSLVLPNIVTAATNTKITYNAKGLVTAGVAATPADVGLSNVTNDAQLKIASNLSDVASATTARGNISAVLKQALTAYAGGAANATYSQAQIAAIITTLNALVTAINT